VRLLTIDLGPCSSDRGVKKKRESSTMKQKYGFYIGNTNLILIAVSQVSADMKALNRRFGMLHGISSLANLVAVIALGFHGLWIGNVGVQGY